jgi:glucose dehydrogenase
MWTTAAYDDKLGLIYVPLGNATPDYYGVASRGRTGTPRHLSRST